MLLSTLPCRAVKPHPEEASIRISALSDAAGIPVATIKYYIREGLLPHGDRTAATQAAYGPAHVHRLRLLRTLREIGGLPIAAIRRIVAALDDETVPVHALLGIVHEALGSSDAAGTDADDAASRSQVDAVIDGLGWRVSPDATARSDLARTLSSLRRLGYEPGSDALVTYAQAADGIAAWELDRTAQRRTREERVETVVVGTVAYGAALLALRRLAQEHHSAIRFAGPSD